MKGRLAALTIWIAIALTTSCAIATTAQAQTIAPSPPSISTEALPAEQHKSFFTLTRDALDFSKFARRNRSRPRRTPAQIIEAAKQRHQDASSKISVKEKIQQIRVQLPRQSNQLRSRIEELPHKIKESANQASASLGKSLETTSQGYAQKAKSQPFIARIQNRIEQTKQRLKELTISFLEQTSDRIDQAAGQLKS